MNDLGAPGRANRRLTARRACHLAVRYRSRGAWRPASAVDLSRQGCRLRIGEDLERGTRLEVAFETRPAEGTGTVGVGVSGNVIWARREGLSVQVGVQFSEAPPGLDHILTVL